MSEKENKEQMFTHHLMCSKCSMSFSVESEHRSNLKLDLESMSCPVCKSDIQLDPDMLTSDGGAQKSLSHRRKANIERSAQARARARRQKEADSRAGAGETVSIKSYQKGKNKGKTMELPKKVVESIKNKVKDDPALKED